jgi:hypothetical protein
MRTTTQTILAVCITALTVTAGVQSCSAQDRSAQNPDASKASPQTTAAATPAPVGHRQPTLNGLPDSVRDDENGRGRATVDPLGPLPKLCNPC